MSHTSSLHSTAICPYCQSPFDTTEQVVECSRCHTYHHAECWAANGGCTIHGCGNTTSTPVAMSAPISATGAHWRQGASKTITIDIPPVPTTTIEPNNYQQQAEITPQRRQQPDITPWFHRPWLLVLAASLVVYIIVIIQISKDQTPPTIVKTVPAAGYGLKTSQFPDKINIQFSEKIQPDSAMVTVNNGQITGITSYDADNKALTFWPTKGFDSGVTYTVTVKGVRDKANNMMAEKSFSFTIIKLRMRE